MTIRLAPLAGVTDWPFRLLCFEQGCDCAYTEMVSAIGYVYAPKNQATQTLLHRHPDEKRLILQLFGKETDMMARAAEELSRLGRFDGVDINMGCPVPKVAGAGEGSGLMRTPELAETIMREVVRASALPVSVKFRLGWDENSINVVDMARRAQNAGVSEITVHGRTRVQQYSGTADWQTIARVKQAVSIPVLGNGDIFTAEDGLARLRDSGVDGLMIGRGAMGNPWLFSQLKAAMGQGEACVPTVQQRVETALRHYDMLLQWKPRRVAVNEMRKHIGWYLHGLRGAAQMRATINAVDDPARVADMLRAYALQAGADESAGE